MLIAEASAFPDLFSIHIMTTPINPSNELTFPVTIEFEDVDSYRIVHHTRYIAFCERARVRLFEKIGYDFMREGIFPVIYDFKIRYVHTARLLDKLIVSTVCTEIEPHRFTLAYRIKNGDKLIVKAQSILTFIDEKSGTSTEIPSDFGKGLSHFKEQK
jgi:acyl-CoA thioester hydrolase